MSIANIAHWVTVFGKNAQGKYKNTNKYNSFTIYHSSEIEVAYLFLIKK